MRQNVLPAPSQGRGERFCQHYIPIQTLTFTFTLLLFAAGDSYLVEVHRHQLTATVFGMGGHLLPRQLKEDQCSCIALKKIEDSYPSIPPVPTLMPLDPANFSLLLA